MSNTPRTDAQHEAFMESGMYGEFTPVALCRQLERELTAANEQIRGLETIINGVKANGLANGLLDIVNRNQALEAENGRMRNDHCGCLGKNRAPYNASIRASDDALLAAFKNCVDKGVFDSNGDGSKEWDELWNAYVQALSRHQPSSADGDKSEIMRYNIKPGYYDENRGVDEHPSGEYVLYTDHLKALEESALPRNRADYIARLIVQIRNQIEKDPDAIKAKLEFGEEVTISKWLNVTLLCDVVESDVLPLGDKEEGNAR